ncbi:putative NADPH-dependent methylglyoxal reductase [Nadsonia fulvescens var. elongata DSM 6958]|uniref:Putative NADPH-dependent methylglyoxal reductase n=1 Tax=Nadsonia fulvescens var. elongata DSM 6958 TaxID=857566 RepID=A0A1E3PSR4_9ASCO|nr:putative NADPH-dependent methylglyoxal reductase [Nadsonia fulvescens var. elongata DSM 6958]
MAISEKLPVLLTGASGYLASHILDILLNHGYPVVATVRSEAKASFIANRHDSAQTSKQLQFAIVPDIVAVGAFDNVFLNHPDIYAVIHTASPFHSKIQDPIKDILDPAILGTKNVLNSILTHGSKVTKFVLTSSNAAITDPALKNDGSACFNEDSWSPVTWEQAVNDRNLTYRGSKKFAEIAAWDFARDNAADLNPEFSITTINPPMIFGPMVHDVTLNTLNESSNALYKLIKSSPPNDTSLPTQPYPIYVDVRDAALAHVLALERGDSARNKRWYVVGGYFTTQDVLDILHKHFEDQVGGKIAIGKPGQGALSLINSPKYDNSRTVEQSGLKFIPLEKTIVDLYTQFLQLEKCAKTP